MKEKKKRKKSFLLTLILAVVLVLAYFAKGGSFLAIFSQFQKPNVDKNTILKKDNEQKKEILIYMQFISDVLEIDGIKCIKQGDIEKTIKQLQKKYKNKDVTVKYLQHANDPFVAAKRAENYLKSNNFDFVISSK